jgi:hypothetical protein
VQRVVRTLPKDSYNRNHVVQRIAELLHVISKPSEKHKREQRSLAKELQVTVTLFYNRDDTSYQMSDKRDCIEGKG